MNTIQTKTLRDAVAGLSNGFKVKDIRAIERTYKRIKKTVADIYKGEIDVPSVLRVEQIVYDGQIDGTVKTQDAYQQLDKLVRQTESGTNAYKLFIKSPKRYVEYAEGTRKNVTVGKHSLDGVPLDPVRSALIELRKELVTQMNQIMGEPFQDKTDTNRTRFDVLIRAERNYLSQYIGNRKHISKSMKEQDKTTCLKSFDQRMNSQRQRVEPAQELKQLNKKTR